MSVTLFVIAEAPGATPSAVDLAGVEDVLRSLPGLREGLVHRPLEEMPDHPFTADGAGPALVLELRFDDLAAAEAALQPEALGRLAVPSLPGARLSHQVFAARDFPVAEPGSVAEPCTFLIRYHGVSPDPEAWLDHYDAHHPPIMVRFPGIRRVVTYRPLAWESGLTWARAGALQRNKVVFDSAPAFTAALASPVMAEMRADRAAFPPFEGAATHHPMRTRPVG